jgi:hypothetical protein
VPGERPISSLILTELLESGDGGEFVENLIAYRGSFKPLLGLIERWKKDRSERARRMKLLFIGDDRLAAVHRVVIKRLFKQAWHDDDDELMGVFLVRFDRALRRGRAKRYRYVERALVTEEVLRLRPDYREPGVFSRPTMHYLRRRAWRYFRRAGFERPEGYAPAIARALVRFSDDDVRRGENLLDNWGLMHACFGKSPVLVFDKRHTNVRHERGLAELAAAPMFERHWAAPAATQTLLSILLDAQARPVRVWAVQLLRRHHLAALANIDAGLLLRLIDHADPDVATFAAELLQTAALSATLPLATWLRLLATRNPTVVSAVVVAFRRHVSFDRVSLSQAVEIATQAATPVARLGMEILRGRQIRTSDHVAIAELAAARSTALGTEIAAFALPVLNTAKAYQLDRVIGFFDSPLESMRRGGFAALTDDSPAAADPAFWAALLESPYDDVRSQLVARLKARQPLPAVRVDQLTALWQSVLLNIHRGGRAKLTALAQISRQLVRDAESAQSLMPIVAVAIRSVRAPEARHALAAVVAAVERVPGLAPVIARHLPELRLDAPGVVG